MKDKCENCYKPSGTYFFDKESKKWFCDDCWNPPPLMDTCRPFEYGHENKDDPKGSTAHVRDIKARRLDTKTKQMYYYAPPKTYFLPK